MRENEENDEGNERYGATVLRKRVCVVAVDRHSHDADTMLVRIGKRKR